MAKGKKDHLGRQVQYERIRYCPYCKQDRAVQHVMHMHGKTKFRDRCKTCNEYVK